jgi:2,4-diaminopentanoate dehydrogenase
MGFGKGPGEFDQRRFAHGAHSFGPSLRVFADAVGLPLDEVVSTGSVATATADTEIAAGPIAAGTVAAQRMAVTGLRDGVPLVGFSAHWYCTTAIDADWDLGATGWRITVDGDCPLDVDLRFAVSLDRMAATAPGYTANRAVNAVPLLCDAPPGIHTSVDLPQVVALLG